MININILIKAEEGQRRRDDKYFLDEALCKLNRSRNSWGARVW